MRKRGATFGYQGKTARAGAPLIKLEIQFPAGLASLCQDRQRNVSVPWNKQPNLSPLICSANSQGLESLALNGQKVGILVGRFITGDIAG